jgi:hypothetical protein
VSLATDDDTNVVYDPSVPPPTFFYPHQQHLQALDTNQITQGTVFYSPLKGQSHKKVCETLNDRLGPN